MTFTKDIREDDAEPLLQAIRMLKGVAVVSPVVNQAADRMIEIRTEHHIENRLIEALNTIFHSARTKSQ